MTERKVIGVSVLFAALILMWVSAPRADAPVRATLETERVAELLLASRPQDGFAKPLESRDIAPRAIQEKKLVGATISFGDELFVVRVPEGSTVYDAMALLRDEGKTSFRSTFYPALGHFVEEIDGRKNDKGYYWTLYMNGSYSNGGASSAKVSEGDAVEWRYQNKI